LRPKILKKLRTARLNSEFIGSYKKSVADLTWRTVVRLSLNNWKETNKKQ